MKKIKQNILDLINKLEEDGLRWADTSLFYNQKSLEKSCCIMAEKALDCFLQSDLIRKGLDKKDVVTKKKEVNK